MEILFKNQSNTVNNSIDCVVIEYPLQEKTLNFAIAKIRGRYPNKGYAINLECKEIAYIQDGIGKLNVNGTVYALNPGDIVLIEANEKYYWEGNMCLHISCSPAFNKEQHKIIEQIPQEVIVELMA